MAVSGTRRLIAAAAAMSSGNRTFRSGLLTANAIANSGLTLNPKIKSIYMCSSLSLTDHIHGTVG